MFPDVTVPEPTAFFFPRWFGDPLYRGSYSNWPANLVSQHRTNLRANLGRLWFAGEALSEKHFGMCLVEFSAFGDATVLIFDADRVLAWGVLRRRRRGREHRAVPQGPEIHATTSHCRDR